MDFADALVTTLVDDAPMHRLWYDLRSQALFEARLRADVLDIDAALERMIWQVVSRYAELRGAPAAMPSAARLRALRRAVRAGAVGAAGRA